MIRERPWGAILVIVGFAMIMNPYKDTHEFLKAWGRPLLFVIGVAFVLCAAMASDETQANLTEKFVPG